MEIRKGLTITLAALMLLGAEEFLAAGDVGEAIKKLATITEHQINVIAARHKVKPQRKFWFWKKELDDTARQAVFDAKQVELKSINSAIDGKDLSTQHVKVISLAFTKIELLGLPAYSYENPERKEEAGTFSKFDFLTDSDIDELRLMVFNDLSTMKTPKDGDAAKVVEKHLKLMITEKFRGGFFSRYFGRRDFKKVLAFRSGMIRNDDLYKENRIWFDKFLVAQAEYKGIEGALRREDEFNAGEAAALNDQLKSVIADKKRLKSQNDTAPIADFKTQLQGMEKQQADILRQLSAIKSEEQSERGDLKKVGEAQLQQINKLLQDFQFLDANVEQKLDVAFMDEFYIHLAKNVLFNTEMIIGFIMAGIPITATALAMMSVGLAPGVWDVFNKTFYVECANLANLRQEMTPFNLTCYDQAKLFLQKALNGSVSLLDLKSKDATGNPLVTGEWREGLDHAKRNIDGFSVFLKDAIANNNDLVKRDFSINEMIKRIDENIPAKTRALEVSEKYVKTLADEARSLSGFNWDKLGMAAKGLAPILGLPLLCYAQNKLIDAIVTSPNKKKYQKYYAFWELKNTLPDKLARLRKITSEPASTEEK